MSRDFRRPPRSAPCGPSPFCPRPACGAAAHRSAAGRACGRRMARTARRAAAVAPPVLPPRARPSPRPDPRPSDRVSAVQARADIQAMGSCPGFEATLKATVSRRYVCGPSIEAPVTVAFGSRDLLLLRHQSCHLDELPPTTRTAPLHGCGHVPISDDPAAVVDLSCQAFHRPMRTVGASTSPGGHHHRDPGKLKLRRNFGQLAGAVCRR
jgi:hypothetical protein